MTLSLCDAGVLREPLLHASPCLERNRARYYELLDLVRREGDWEAWLEFFASSVAEAAQGAVDTAVRLSELFALDRSRIEGAVDALVRLGVAREFTGRRRARLFVYDRYVAILGEGTEVAADR